MVNGNVATAVNGLTAANDSEVTSDLASDVTPEVTRDGARDGARDAARDATRDAARDAAQDAMDVPATSGELTDVNGDSTPGRSGTATPTDPVAAELASLRHSLDHAVDLYEGYRESAAERALRITQLLTDLDERETRLAQLRSEVQQSTREHQQQLAAAVRRYRSLRQRRGVRLALRLAAAVKRVRGPSGRSPGS
ncbi:hypothetical protein ABN028_18820 [Actinopolymorpha sp. B17G11]|uniref:hypothetical protein n=1 Tax=Actinopolymorpha sp. B17G11 TaxID=3160861 RepID=UPI0032E3B3C8